MLGNAVIRMLPFCILLIIALLVAVFSLSAMMPSDNGLWHPVQFILKISSPLAFAGGVYPSVFEHPASPLNAITAIVVKNIFNFFSIYLEALQHPVFTTSIVHYIRSFKPAAPEVAFRTWYLSDRPISCCWLAESDSLIIATSVIRHASKAQMAMACCHEVKLLSTPLFHVKH